jgi:hypothetical protein
MSKLIKSFEGFTIWSGDYKKLAKWYQDIFELEQKLELDIPGDHAIAFEIEPGNDMMLWIGSHSEVKGKSKDPFRQMISFWVDDVYKVNEILKEKKIEIVAGPGKSPDGELNFLTARDPELNLIQMFSK